MMLPRPECRSRHRFSPQILSLLAVCCFALLAAASSDAAERPVSFRNEIVPLLTKAGCNAGVCHAKAGNGQNGFQLSLLGFEPLDDYEQLVKKARGRRLSFAAPDHSLILLKASAQVPHGGGRRLDPSSEGYALLRQWIAQGAPWAMDDEPQFESFEVQPARGTVARGGRQQLKALAHYNDGSIRDVTGLALYESNNTAMAEVEDRGLVNIHDISGNVAIMVRYQGRVAVYSVSVPLGAPVENLPPAKNFVDEHVFANLKELGIPPSPVCDDATFLRRVTLDVAGRLPTEEEATTFAASSDHDKREKAIDALLATPDYADYFANKWTALLKNRRDVESDQPGNFAFHAWVRDSLLANKPYNQFVRELLAATGSVSGNPPVAWYGRVTEPKQQVEDVAQLFLGVRVQCAQCHHHPFERWSQDDYYALTAFFTRIGRKPENSSGAPRAEVMIFHRRGAAAATNVKTGASLKPAALGDAMPPITPDEDPRLRLADWMSAEHNPFFARALVNRYWKHFFGRGLVEPEDDIRDTNPPTNPALLAALERHFIASGFDLKALVRVIAGSSVYQLSATPNEFNVADTQNYSRFYPRRLPAEAMLDAIDHLAGTKTDFANLPPGTRAVALPDNSYNRSIPFLKVFGRPEGESVCECERVQSSSLAQSLHLINASDIKSKLADANGRAQRLAQSGGPVEQKVRELYLAAFAREPRPEEVQIAEDYLAEPRVGSDGKPVDAQGAARENLQDLLWALINTKEFLFNH
ncbi:MAG TPA: DUF1549 and DUF1553 domain-containing protein [Pirellulales bacterium]|nr:DUF1549 and DUF1553 domain-containing protein [Pirellulales bacterium]